MLPGNFIGNVIYFQHKNCSFRLNFDDDLQLILCKKENGLNEKPAAETFTETNILITKLQHHFYFVL